MVPIGSFECLKKNINTSKSSEHPLSQEGEISKCLSKYVPNSVCWVCLSFSGSIDMKTSVALVKTSRSLSTGWISSRLCTNSLNTTVIWAVHVRQDCRVRCYKWEPNVVRLAFRYVQSGIDATGCQGLYSTSLVCAQL